MKNKTWIIDFFIIAVFMISLSAIVGCGKSPAAQQKKDSTAIGNVVSVFELKYGEPQTISINNLSYRFSIMDVHDSSTGNVMPPINEADYVDISSLITRAYIKANNTTVNVISKPLGAFPLNNDGHDIEQTDSIINSFQVYKPDTSEDYKRHFQESFGSGNYIPGTQLKLYMAKSYPVGSFPLSPVTAPKQDYKFIFILTDQNN